VKPRFQADADLHFDIVTGILRREPLVDFQSAQEILRDGMSDQQVLAAAHRDGRILVSHDVNTMPVAFQNYLEIGGRSPGLFLLSQSLSISTAIEELLLVWSLSEIEEWQNRIVWLPL
jgi:predicted nuclease of predicted toxin-antitoxin system